MHRIATILLTVSTLAATGCEQTRQSLRRVEVWKQQTFFAPSTPNTVEFNGPLPGGPAFAQDGGLQPIETSPEGAISHGAASFDIGSPEYSPEFFDADAASLPITAPTNELSLPSPEEVHGILEQP